MKFGRISSSENAWFPSPSASCGLIASQLPLLPAEARSPRKLQLPLQFFVDVLRLPCGMGEAIGIMQ